MSTIKKILKFIINSVTGIIIYTVKNILNDVIVFYIKIKNFLKIINIIINKNLLLKFPYKKLIIELTKEIKKVIYIKKKEIFKVISIFKYLLYKYILKYSFVKLFIKYILDLNFTDLKLYISNKLDICLKTRNIVLYLIKFLYTFIIYIIDKYYKNIGEFSFLIKCLINKNISFKIINKVKKFIKIELIDRRLLPKELKFLIKIFYENYNYIILSNLNDKY